MATNISASGKRAAYTRLVLVLVVLFAILGVFMLYLATPLLQGTTVVLAIRPIDPFDPLRGQYLTINYEIGLLNKTTGLQEGDSAYVSLAPDAAGVWRKIAVNTFKPEGVFIKGTVTSARGEQLLVTYGIEQYFFEKGATLPNVSYHEVTVEVKVDKNGRAGIVQLLHNGKPMEFQYRDVELTS